MVLINARSRLRYGQRMQPEVSPFVEDISKDLIVRERVERKEKSVEQLSLW